LYFVIYISTYLTVNSKNHISSSAPVYFPDATIDNFTVRYISVLDISTNLILTKSIVVTDFSAEGILHSNSSGQITSSKLVNSDIDDSAAIADSKLGL